MSADPEPEPLGPGTRLGPYVITSFIGAGAMGEVYSARDERLGRSIAIKVLSPHGAARPGGRERFEREARAASALEHPNICVVHDVGSEAGVDFIVMEHLEGETLAERLRRGPMSRGDAVRCAIQIAGALEAAHRGGIVHRDLKPSNLMLTRSGVKLLDFGLARVDDAIGVADAVQGTSKTGSTDTELTLDGALLGTVPYMSPEQVDGRGADPRSDIWTLGAVLYEMLSGRRAFEGASAASVIAAILERAPASLEALDPPLPPALGRLVMRCLEKRPEDRFQSVSDVAFALQTILDGSGQLEPLTSRPRGRRRRRLGLVLGLAAALVAGVAWLALRWAWAPPVGQPRTTRLTSLEGWEGNPSISPDGNLLAYAWEDLDGKRDLYVRTIDTGVVKRLGSEPARDIGIAWSPDGHSLVFRRGEGGLRGLYTVSILGGEPRLLRRVVDLLGGQSWSPDGRTIAFGDRDASGRAGVFLTSIEGDAPRRLTTPPAGYADENPIFSPDGQTILFRRALRTLNDLFPFHGDLYLVPVTGGSPRPLTSMDTRFTGWSWTPDGREVIFSAGFYEAAHLYKISSVGGRAELLTPEGEGVHGVSIATAERRLVYSRWISQSQIWRVDARPRGTRRSATHVVTSTANDLEPDYSPDGRKIAFMSSRSGWFEIWTCGSDGSDCVQMTSLGSYAGSPRWSPDGREIAFDFRGQGKGDIHVLDVETRQTRRLTSEASEDNRPAWSRDGRFIYFASDRSGSVEIWRIPARGGPAEQITSGGGQSPTASPDGRFLYYWREGGLSRMPVGGDRPTFVLPGWALLKGVATWVPTEDGLYFYERDDTLQPPRSTLQFLSLTDGRRREVYEMAPPGLGWPGLAVSPDGRWLLFQQTSRDDSDIYMVENYR